VSWSIQIPFSSRSDSIISAADAARGLSSPYDAAVTRQIVPEAATGGTAAAAGVVYLKRGDR
jgi:hypothetical protein